MGIRLVNAAGRASLLIDGRLVDVERASGGRFGADPMDALHRWDAFGDWARGVGPGVAETPVDELLLGPPVPRPQKVFGIGLNYRDHAAEAKLEAPAQPMVFTKFASCLAGPRADVPLTSAFVDWEVELVVVIGRHGRHVPAGRALDHVAGYAVGQDISDRKQQFADKPPQFSIGKSADGFGPFGPAVVSLDAGGRSRTTSRSRATSTASGCRRAARASSSSRCRSWSRSSPAGARSSRATSSSRARPGATGSTRTPRRYLKPGDQIVSTIEGLGRLSNHCIAEQR